MWGKDWIQAKTQSECYDYLFHLAVKMHGMGLDASRPPPPVSENGATHTHATPSEAGAVQGPLAKRQRTGASKRPTAIILDIEVGVGEGGRLDVNVCGNAGRL